MGSVAGLCPLRVARKGCLNGHRPGRIDKLGQATPSSSPNTMFSGAVARLPDPVAGLSVRSRSTGHDIAGPGSSCPPIFMPPRFFRAPLASFTTHRHVSCPLESFAHTRECESFRVTRTDKQTDRQVTCLRQDKDNPVVRMPPGTQISPPNSTATRPRGNTRTLCVKRN